MSIEPHDTNANGQKSRGRPGKKEELEMDRQRAAKQYNHPPDLVMSFIYALVADKRHDPNPFSINKVLRK
jgi:hypothetical protein